MKKFCVISILVIGLLLIVWAFTKDYSAGSASTKLTLVEFCKTEIDMGQLEQGMPQTVSFQFTNKGGQALLIKHVETSCGCTQPIWPKTPVKPGESAEITVNYDAKSPGLFFKTITVFCNTERGMIELKIKGTVMVP